MWRKRVPVSPKLGLKKVLQCSACCAVIGKQVWKGSLRIQHFTLSTLGSAVHNDRITQDPRTGPCILDVVAKAIPVEVSMDEPLVIAAILMHYVYARR